MKTLFCAIAIGLLAQAGLGEELLGTYKWSEIKTLPRGATVVQVDGREALKIENTNDAPLQVNLLTIFNPKITAQIYELVGDVRYENVKGDGYLEMWNYFPPNQPGLPEEGYFSRTLGDSGPMGKITGTSGWRDFTLPFNRTGASGAPTRLQVNLILPGHGTVYIGPVKLLQLPKAKSASGMVYPNSWWSAPTTGKIFGWGGAVIGCFGGLCGWLASKGKARGFVLAVLAIFTGLGVASGVAGLLALAAQQPVFVWSPLIFSAVILASVSPFNLRQFRRRYEELELRRMASLDASGA